uniref:CHK kinase-like domain-containing protein n=1 Tax=Anopheles atroparvus TaxID=41427 RepID=A0AAG5CV12_ANOAO
MVELEWMNRELLATLLADQLSSNHLLSYEVNYATKKGDNYASEMYRLRVHFKCNATGDQVHKNFILKVMPSGYIQQQVMKENSIYPRETVIYRDILPRIYELLRTIGDDSIISPICVSTASSPKELLLFEDARDAGFRMADRRLGLELDAARLVIVKLAKLHACSRMLYETEPQLFELMLEGCISDDPNKQTYLPYYRRCVQQVIRLVTQWNENGQWDTVLMKLEKLQDKIIPYGCDVYRRADDGFNVLNHNDIWINNMMFRYDDDTNRVDDLRLLDYQLSFYGSPGVDLNFFLYGSVRAEVRTKHANELVQLYHGTLRSTMERLQYRGPIPSLPDVHVEIIRKGFHRVNAVFQQLPIAMMENSEEAEMDVLLGDGEHSEACRRELFDNPRYVSVLPALLREFDLGGFLD